MTYLLDSNVLIAILDPDHVDHEIALRWWDDEGHGGWATTPIVQNGVVRIMGAAGYDRVPFSCAEVADVLARWVNVPEHSFWPDDLSLLTDPIVERSKLTSPGRVTDTYLLAMAVRHRARFATLDRRVASDTVRGGQAALHVIRSQTNS